MDQSFCHHPNRRPVLKKSEYYSSSYPLEYNKWACHILLSVCSSTYTPIWNEDFIIMVENEASPVTFQVMDWNRVEKHELVGFAMISSADLRSLLEEDIGHECQLAVPVIKAGTVVEGHDHHKCHLNLLVKVLKAAPRTVAVPKKKRVSKPCNSCN
jgi:hypothetical protein